MGNKDILGFGKTPEDIAKPVGIAGENNDELLVYSMEEAVLFKKILKELKKFNVQLETITETRLTTEDAHAYKNKL
jgi:hypothetical protein